MKVRKSLDNSTKSPSDKKKAFSELKVLAIKLLGFVIALYIAFGYILGVNTMPSEYMDPSIKYHDNVIYSRISTDYFLRNVIVYDYEGTTYLGRIVGTPGDTIQIDDQGNLFQNGHLVYETDIFLKSSFSPNVEVTLGEGEYFVLCDNRAYLNDSRTFGAIDESQIKGVVITVVRRFGI